MIPQKGESIKDASKRRLTLVLEDGLAGDDRHGLAVEDRQVIDVHIVLALLLAAPGVDLLLAVLLRRLFLLIDFFGFTQRHGFQRRHIAEGHLGEEPSARLRRFVDLLKCSKFTLELTDWLQLRRQLSRVCFWKVRLGVCVSH